MTNATELLKRHVKHTDFEIISKVLAGDKTLFEVILRRYNHFLYKIGRSYGYNHHDSEDLMQETYISVYNNLVGFENRSSFKTWVTRIMLNHCYQKKQKFSFQKESLNENDLSETSNPMFQNNESADKAIMNKELGHLLENALMHIPQDYRMVFAAREMNELNVAETAEVLSISENNVKVRLNRAKKMLRMELGKIYSPRDIFGEYTCVHCDKMVAIVMKLINQLNNQSEKR